MSILGNILKGAIPTVHDLTDGATIALRSGSGAAFDPADLDASVGGAASVVVPCSAPWPYRSDGLAVESGMQKVSIDGQRQELTVTPAPGMHAELDGRTYLVDEAHHDLDGDEWILTLRGAG